MTKRYFSVEQMKDAPIRQEFKDDFARYLHHRIKGERDSLIIGFEDNEEANDYYYIVADFYVGAITYELANNRAFIETIEL